MNYRDEILRYIDKHGIVDKDAMLRGHHSRKKRRSSGKRSRKQIDLHGKTAREAERALAFALERCMESGTKELLVIHGVGWHSDPNQGPVLKTLVKRLLETEFREKIRSYRPAALSNGGPGCTIVRLK